MTSAGAVLLPFTFFFSSRRRHTRLTCDWSSDVCSSDLECSRHARDHFVRGRLFQYVQLAWSRDPDARTMVTNAIVDARIGSFKIGRASCRERVYSMEEGEPGQQARNCGRTVSNRPDFY